MSVNSILPVKFTSTVNNPKNVKQEIPEKNTISTTTKVIGGLSALALLGTAIYCEMRGKKVKISAAQKEILQDLINNDLMDKDYLKIFKDTEYLCGEKFIRTAYAKLAEKVDLTKPPELIVKKQIGSSSSCFDSIILCTGSFKSRADFFSCMRHELEHAKQSEMIYRAFGKDAFLDAYAERAVTQASLNPISCSKNFNGKSSLKNVTPEEIKAFKDATKAEMSDTTSRLDEILKLKGKILQGTPEYEEAKKYLEASRNYKSPAMLTGGGRYKQEFIKEITSAYKENLLEVNAGKEGDRISDMYKKFVEIIGK